MFLKRLKGRKRKALDEMINEPVILELKNGRVYGGLVDECYYDGGEVVALYSCKLLDKKNNGWIEHDIMMEFEDRIIRDSMPDFWISSIKNIFVLPEKYKVRLTLEEILQIYINPHYRPLERIRCNWGPEKNHAKECDASLHEALSYLLTQAEFGISRTDKKVDKQQERKLGESFDYIRRRLLIYGAKIP